MGMYDSFTIKCPNCNRQLEFQSKSGPCMLANFTEEDLPTDVAVGINGDVVMCEFCKINWELTCDLPEIVTVKLSKTKRAKNYSGNYNPELPENIKRTEELRKMIREGK